MEGKHQKQALAIAYALKKRGKKMARGGMMTKDGYESSSSANHQTLSRPIHEKSSGFMDHKGDVRRPDHAAMEEDDRLLNQHGEHEEGPEGEYMAEGGYLDLDAVHGEHMTKRGDPNSHDPNAQDQLHDMENDDIEVPHVRGPISDELRMPEKKAMGGYIGSHQTSAHDEDMVGRIMKQRQHMYSEGGRVANGGEDDLSRMADGRPNNFDDLALRDDLSFHEDGENSGDHLGNAREDHDRADIVARIMKSRAKKDRLPNPR